LAGEPTLLRRLVGAELRRLREARGITREEAGYAIRSSESKISRVELGRVSFKARDVSDLLSMYGLAEGDADRERVIALAKQANAPAWWRHYGDLVPAWFDNYIGLESGAEIIRTYEAQIVPGLLQTRDYIRAVVRSVFPHATKTEIERLVDLRVTRQEQALHRNPAPTLWAVVDEAALRRRIGGTDVLRGQLEALVAATQQPNIKIQIMPFTAGGHSALTGAFTILRFPEDDLTDIVYLELIGRALYLDRPDEIEAYGRTMEELCVDAYPPGHTAELLLGMLKELADPNPA
jgi:transcriptional regulator with XRE-family HTH domain